MNRGINFYESHLIALPYEIIAYNVVNVRNYVPQRTSEQSNAGLVFGTSQQNHEIKRSALQQAHNQLVALAAVSLTKTVAITF